MSALRPLAPSIQQGEFSASSSAKNASSGGDGDSGGGADEGSGGGDGSDPWSKRRRTAGTVSANACTSCRQARQKVSESLEMTSGVHSEVTLSMYSVRRLKTVTDVARVFLQCDGVKPEACSRCRSRKQSCHYELHTKVHKDDLIRELERSRAHNTELENSNKESRAQNAHLLDQNKDLQQSSDWQKIILETIGSNGHDRDIIRKLRDGESHQNIADWLQRINPEFAALAQEPSTRRNLTEVVKIFEDQCHEDDGLRRTGRPLASQSPWTQVTKDTRLLGHLLDLYFTWVHPVHMLFSELDFKRDFRNNEHIYCAPSLVNAICAMACHLLETDGRHERQLIDVGRGDNAATLRQGFFEEAKRVMTPEPGPSMTSTQAFAIMYLTDLSSGKARSATAYLRSAIDGIKSIKSDQQSEEAKEITFWGMRVLIT